MKVSGDPCVDRSSPPVASGDLTFCTSDYNFDFAFNSSNFSDRVLHIQIVADLPESCHFVDVDDDLDSGRRQRWEGDVNERESLEYLPAHACEVAGGGFTTPTGESPSAYRRLDDDLEMDDTAYSIDLSQVIRIKTIYISSAILASKSPFFYKLFSNGMKESDQRYATLRISESEEDSFMELMRFIYSGNLNTQSPDLLLEVLMVADKFEVASCMWHCCHLLKSLPMTKESALIYLDLPSNISVASAVQSLTCAAKNFLANTYKDVTKCHDEVLTLPLVGIEAILSCNDLQVASEDVVFDLVLKWARVHYPSSEERREILGSHLLRHIRFPHMTCRKLRKVLSCPDLDSALVAKVVAEALLFKADAPHRQRALAADESNHGQYTERAYKYRPIKVMEFDRPHPQCIVYLDLKREECTKLFPSGRVYSQAFQLGGQGFFLSAHCNMDQQSSFHCFGLFLGMQEKGAVSFSIDYEFAARTSLSGDFVSKYKGCYTFTGGKAVGYRNLFGMPWTSFIAEDSHFFINGILHLRAELTIKKPS